MCSSESSKERKGAKSGTHSKRRNAAAPSPLSALMRPVDDEGKRGAPGEIDHDRRKRQYLAMRGRRALLVSLHSTGVVCAQISDWEARVQLRQSKGHVQNGEAAAFYKWGISSILTTKWKRMSTSTSFSCECDSFKNMQKVEKGVFENPKSYGYKNICI